MIRHDSRTPDQLRPISFQPGIAPNSTGSVLSICGETRVICTVNITSGVPGWMRDKASEAGWLTAEYSMLPGATKPRFRREKKGPGGRSSEIQRLIGRSLRAAVDLKKLAGFTVEIDCDVLAADGGTRCASINGAMAALQLAVKSLMASGEMSVNPITCPVAAISCGIVDRTPLLDINYVEDSSAEVDMNFIINAENRFVEIQGTGEENTFTRDEFNQLADLAEAGIAEIHKQLAEI